MRASRTGTTDLPAKLLARFADDIAHPDPLQAARVGFMIAAIAREKILFGEAPHAASTALTDGTGSSESSPACSTATSPRPTSNPIVPCRPTIDLPLGL